jgi:hypothetical protein
MVSPATDIEIGKALGLLRNVATRHAEAGAGDHDGDVHAYSNILVWEGS